MPESVSLDRFAQRLWYERRFAFLSLILLPFAWLFAVVVCVRRWGYRHGIFNSVRVDRPVVVIGNLTVGGTGKTPLVLWLTNECRRQGVRAAIVCRGYGGSHVREPVVVSVDSDPRSVGDEAVLLAQSFDGPVVACVDRVAAARHAIERGADIVLCDDGLQHYRLRRDVEIAVVDGERGFGNRRLLPAGPLREPRARAAEVLLLVRTLRGSSSVPCDFGSMPFIDVRMRLQAAKSLLSAQVMPLTEFTGERVHAVAGIGNPQAFFGMLRAHGLDLDARALPDHADIAARDLDFGDRAPVLMTDKDAVKCRAFADERLWRVPLELEIGPAGRALLWGVIQRSLDRHELPH